MEEIRSKLGPKIFRAEDGKEYARIYGGFAWPGLQPGFVLALGEQYIEDETSFKTVGYHLLGEAESMDVRDLIIQAIGFQDRYSVQGWYGQPQHTPFMSILSRFNRESGGPSLVLNTAPHVGDPGFFSFATAQIRDHLQKGSLFIPKGSRLFVYLENLKPEQRRGLGVEEYPSIAALGYCLLALDVLSPEKILPDSRPDRGESEFHSFFD